ncbi:MAG TPA: PGPGW domain-containing protein [Acidimicrobiales bacterium]|nr:PGPGW domain-containing protein [Acidimicrobiales bacterium]
MPARSESRFVAVVRFAFRSSKQIAVTVVGAALVLAGIAMLVLPGPGILVVVAGFAVLGTEYAWAAAALDRTKATAERAGQVAKGAAGSSVRVAKGAAVSTGRAARGAAGGAAGRLRRRRGSGGVGDV